ERVLPVAQQSWDEISYAGGLWAAACARAGHTCNPLPVAVDLQQCTSCNWMLNGCVFGAKRSMLLNYLPAAETCATDIRPPAAVPDAAYAIGRPSTTASYDYLDASLPEFSRFSLEQIYFPPIVDILAEDGVDGPPVWFGTDKRTLGTKFPSWLTVLAMTEDANEGVFGPPPPTGTFTRVSVAA